MDVNCEDRITQVGEGQKMRESERGEREASELSKSRSKESHGQRTALESHSAS